MMEELEKLVKRLPSKYKWILESHGGDEDDDRLHGVILLTLGVILGCIEHARFYDGRKPIVMHGLHTEVYRRIVALVESWQQLLRPSPELETDMDITPSERQVALFADASTALCEVLEMLTDTSCAGALKRSAAMMGKILSRYATKVDKSVLKAFEEAAVAHVGELVDCACRLELVELRIVAEHPEWCRSDSGMLRARCEALEHFHAENPGIARHFWNAATFAGRQLDGVPMPFTRWSRHAPGNVLSFANSVRATLAVRPVIAYLDPSEEDSRLYGRIRQNAVCAPLLGNLRDEMHYGLLSYFQRRMKEFAGNETILRKWLSANAALPWIVGVRSLQRSTTDDINRFCERAADAQRESWTERMLHNLDGEDGKSVRRSSHPADRARDVPEILGEILAELQTRGRKPGGKPAAANRRKGSGRHGTKTEKMDEQLSEFKAYLRSRKITKACNVGYWAGNFWRDHLEDYVAAAKASGEKRGYGDYGKLAGAYRSWLRLQAVKRAKARREKSKV